MKWLIGVTAASVLSGCVWLMPVDSALKYSHGRHIGRIADRLGLPQERGLVTRQNGELTEVWSWRASRDLYQEKATYLTGEVKTDKGKMPFSERATPMNRRARLRARSAFPLTTRESSMRLTTAHRCRPRRATACSCVCRPSSGRTATAAAASRHHGRHAVPAGGGARDRNRTGTALRPRDFRTTSAFAAGASRAVRGLEHAFAIALRP